jgi:pyruvate/2-oxoglutarate dehydrogenase complex dihydrolipoamide dehydrogenase (E3) component
MDMNQSFDITVISRGLGGYAAAIGAMQRGLNLAP